MPEEALKVIFPHNQEALDQYRLLCRQEGLHPEEDFDLLLGFFDEAGQLLAAGGVRFSTIRGLVCRPDRRGEGLIARLVSQLIQEEGQKGHFDLFLYGKLIYQDLYRALGFYPLATAQETMVFMENSPDRFANYLQGLQAQTRQALPGWSPQKQKEGSGAIVLNANPLTRGHLALLDGALAQESLVHLFLLSEDVSRFSFADRWSMLTQSLDRDWGPGKVVVAHPSGHYLISAASFPSYFLKDLNQAALVQAEIDAKIFLQIAASLGITDRFLGSEEDPLTAAYNEVLQDQLGRAGLTVHVMPRKLHPSGRPYSASRVRSLLEAGRLEEALTYLPPASQCLVREKYG